MARLAVEAYAVGRPSPPGAVYEMIAAETTIATDPQRPDPLRRHHDRPRRPHRLPWNAVMVDVPTIATIAVESRADAEWLRRTSDASLYLKNYIYRSQRDIASLPKDR